MEAAAAIYTPTPSDEEAARFGLTVEEASGPPVQVWPDNMPAVELFSDLATQWRRAGMAGAVTGLDYAAIPAVFALRGVPKKQWSALFSDLRVMEDAAIGLINKK
jgi:hypothetical protein